MDEREQRFIIKFLRLQEQGSKAIHYHLGGTLGHLAVSLPAVKRWLRRFKEGDTSCEDRNRAGRPLTIMGDILSKFLSKYPFASAKNIASLRYQRIDNEELPCARAGTPKIYSEMGAAVPIVASEK
jgi:hypothetical protein